MARSVQLTPDEVSPQGSWHDVVAFCQLCRCSSASQAVCINWLGWLGYAAPVISVISVAEFAVKHYDGGP